MPQRDMQQAQALLERAGVRPLARPQPGALRVECSRLARILRERGLHTVGLYPVGRDAGVMSAALELACALAEQGSVVGVVDAAAGWPCAPELAQGGTDEQRAAVTTWVLERLAVLTPRSGGRGGTEQLLDIVTQEAWGFSHLILDLTGFERRGEHVAAAGLVHAWALVARSGRVRAGEVRRWLADLPQPTGLGVLLVGAN
ncbi:MAG: hypothetical protein HZB56_20465 [Deltaproteobacteria bacterium]|nr:hypothetical protein [Deltaproteobacteria bacterium]